MNGRKFALLTICFAGTMLLSGCPLAGSMVAGAWEMEVDGACNPNADSNLYVVYLYPNGEAEFFVSTEVRMGTWELNGTAFTMTFNDFPSQGQVYIFTGTLDGDAMTDGTTLQNGNDPGTCWVAVRLVG